MPCLKEKKVSGLYEGPETNKSQIHNTIKINPEEDIEEFPPEKSPEDMSRKACNFDIGRDGSLGNCPKCNEKLEENTIGGLDPQNSIDYLVCPECHWTDRKFFSEMTPDEVLNNLEEVPF